MYVCYVLKSTVSRRTYVGITNNLKRRIRQHNGEIKGGAKYTRAGRPYKIVFYTGYFPNKSTSMQFETAVKRQRTRKKRGRIKYTGNGGIESRIQDVAKTLKMDRFKDWNLSIHQHCPLLWTIVTETIVGESTICTNVDAQKDKLQVKKDDSNGRMQDYFN